MKKFLKKAYVKRLLDVALMTLLTIVVIMSLYWILYLLIYVFELSLYLIPFLAVIFIIWAIIECIKEGIRG